MKVTSGDAEPSSSSRNWKLKGRFIPVREWEEPDFFFSAVLLGFFTFTTAMTQQL